MQIDLCINTHKNHIRGKQRCQIAALAALPDGADPRWVEFLVISIRVFNGHLIDAGRTIYRFAFLFHVST